MCQLNIHSVPDIRSSTGSALPACCPLRKPEKSKRHLLTLPIVWTCRLLSVACHNQWDAHVPPACSGVGSRVPAPVCLYMSWACLNLNRCRGWSSLEGPRFCQKQFFSAHTREKPACRKLGYVIIQEIDHHFDYNIHQKTMSLIIYDIMSKIIDHSQSPSHIVIF